MAGIAPMKSSGSMGLPLPVRSPSGTLDGMKMVLPNGEFAYSIGETIGVGATGKVKLGVHKETGERVAVKIVSSQLFQEKPDLLSKVLRECDIMASVAHPNVVNFLGKHQTSESLLLVLELVTGGELFDYLIKTGRQSEESARKFFRQLISAVHYCHERNVCHRDIKPENLLLDQAGNVKVADFGYAQYMHHDSKSRPGWVETSCGSPHYASPEVIVGERYLGFQADVWSCGVVLFALLTGGLPFDDDNLQQLLQKVKRGVYSIPSWVPASAADLVRKMLTVNPESRITTAQIKVHPWYLGPEGLAAAAAAAAAVPVPQTTQVGRFSVTPVVPPPVAVPAVSADADAADDLMQMSPGPAERQGYAEPVPIDVMRDDLGGAAATAAGGGGDADAAALYDRLLASSSLSANQRTAVQRLQAAHNLAEHAVSSASDDRGIDPVGHYLKQSASRRELAVLRQDLFALQRIQSEPQGTTGPIQLRPQGDARELERLKAVDTATELQRVRTQVAQLQLQLGLPHAGVGMGMMAVPNMAPAAGPGEPALVDSFWSKMGLK